MSLLAPLFLLGLLGVALPIILHRFSFHEPPQQAFPSSRFLEATTPPASSQKKIKHWMLLMLRACFLIALCLLFAQPFWRQDQSAQQAAQVNLLVLDTSFSMQSGDRWDKALDALSATVADLPAGSASQLFTVDGNLSALTELTTAPDVLRNKAASLTPGFGSTDYGELMRRLNQVAADLKKPVNAVFITDAQRSNLPEKMNSLLADRLTQFEVIDIGGGEDTNFYVAAQARTVDSVHVRATVTVGASASNSGTDNTRTLILSIKDNTVATRSVQLTPGEIKSVEFDQIPLPIGEQLSLTAQLQETDDVSADDVVQVPIQGLEPVTITMAGLGTQPVVQAPVFVKTALESTGAAAVDDLRSALASDARHAIVFIEMEDETTVPADVQQFVESGGSVLVVKNNVQDDNSNARSVSQGELIALIDQAHPLALGEIDWFDLRFHDTPPLALQDEDTVLLALGNGVPILLERDTQSAGSMLILNDTLDGLASDLPLQPAFAVLMQNIMRYFVASTAIPSQITAGNLLSLAPNMQVLSPSGDAMLELSQTANANNVRLDQPGVYSVLDRDKVHSVAVVLETKESDLEVVQRAELDAWEARHVANTNNSRADTAESDAVDKPSAFDIGSDNAGRFYQIWQWLIPAVLLFLFLESLVANRMLWVRRDGL